MKNYFFILLFILSCANLNTSLHAQHSMLINMGMLDGMDISKDNVLNFEVHSSLPNSVQAKVTGTIKYRNSKEYIKYEFTTNITPGINRVGSQVVIPRFSYSSLALKELFEIYKKLPEGIFEYCIHIETDYRVHEGTLAVFDECVYHKSENVFLINLIDPEDDAQLYEYYPMLSWSVNYPFASSLTYKLKVAEIKEGQNPTAAISRNNAHFEYANIHALSMVYPVFAKPLEKFQPYAWNVEAYYKGLFLGRAEAWKFTIIEDSLFTAINTNPPFVDIQQETGNYNLYAVGQLKLKYALSDLKSDTLKMELYNHKNKSVNMKDKEYIAVYGDNRIILDFYENNPLSHLKNYNIKLTSQTGQVFTILFKYINPELID